MKKQKQVSPSRVLKERAEARAMLWRDGEYETFQQAIGPLITYAERRGIHWQAAQAIIETAFK